MTKKLPTPVAGQIWNSPHPRVKDRMIIRVENWKYRVQVVIGEGIGGMSLGEFHRWARRVEAEPLPSAQGKGP